MTKTETKTLNAALPQKGRAMHALASDLVGFSRTTLRVRVTRIDERAKCAWVVTADLADAGTALVLDLAKISPIEGGETIRHKAGLVAFG